MATRPALFLFRTSALILSDDGLSSTPEMSTLQRVHDTYSRC